MQISFVTQGCPNLQTSLMDRIQFQEWLNIHEEAAIEKDDIPISTVHVVKEARIVFTSVMPHAVQSATVLLHTLSFTQDEIFNGVKWAIASLPLWCKLKPSAWRYLNRVFWIFLCNENETYEQANFRAKQAADLLQGYAYQYGKIVVIADGYFNDLIAKQLRSRKWYGPLSVNCKPWGCTIYRWHEVLVGTQNVGFTM